MLNRLIVCLTAVTALLAVGEVVSAFQIAVPGFAIVFAALLAASSLMLWRRWVIPGAVLAALLTLVEVLNYPGWQKHGVGDWIFDSAFAVVSAIGLVLAVVVLAGHLRTRFRARAA